MASLFRSMSRPTLNHLKSSISNSTSAPKLKTMPCLRTPLSSPTVSRSMSRLGSVESLLPLHTAVSSARLTSCLGADSKGSRSLSQVLPDLISLILHYAGAQHKELGLSVPR